MITYNATADTASRVRFSMSPVGETVFSFRLLGSTARRNFRLPWVEDVRPKLRGVDFRPLRAVIPPTGYVPDFLTPPPGARPRDFGAELELVRATTPERFFDEVSWMVANRRGLPEWSPAATRLHRQLLTDPDQSIRTLTELLDIYWRLALEPYWDQLRAELLSDVRSRMRVIESSGVAAVFSSLNERVGWGQGRLTVQSRYEVEADLDEQGIVLVPSMFCGPEVLTMVPPYQSMIVYPRPGGAALGGRRTGREAGPLAALVGGLRAAVLESLVAPASTTDLAEQLTVTPSAVSQHLGVLRDCGLVESRRAGRRVVYSLTETGEALALGVGPVQSVPRR